MVAWHDDHSQQRGAFVSIIPPLVYHLWEPGDKKIAQLALLQVLYALFSRPSSFCGRRGLWFIDNTAALMALIRGRSDNADLEYMSRLIHVTLFALKVGFSGSGSLARPTGQMRSAGTAFRQHGINAMGSPRILQFSPSRFGLYHFPRFYGLWSFSECFGIEVHWERFNLCSLLSSQECRTGCTDPTSAAVQGDTCTAFQSTILRGAG